MDIELIKNKLVEDLNLSYKQVNNVIEMLDEGDTIPFIARYRKERTGSLTDEVLRTFEEKYKYYLSFYDRLDTIVKSIDEQGLLTDEILASLYKAKTLSELEDIYRPYKPKRKTRATIAKAKGLEPLSDYLLLQVNKPELKVFVKDFINPDLGVNNEEEAINGAKDIIAEYVSDNADYRKFIRKKTFDLGLIKSTKIKDEEDKIVFSMYYEYQEPVSKIATHRILALNRGENLGILKVSIVDPRDINIQHIKEEIILSNSPFEKILAEAIEDAYDRLIKPSIENEIRSDITEVSENVSIEVFKSNLKELLLEAPIKDKVVLGFDPGFRTGCKIAIVDSSGKMLYTGVSYATIGSEDKFIQEADKLVYLIQKYHVNLISLGNGTASRESEAFINKYIFERYPLLKNQLDYIITNEAGASVYSASKLGIKEFPDLDVSVRSAISLARRVQDPLAELVKIDPKSIGVGQYQHDMNQKHLSEALDNVVIDCVNLVGVDLNSSSEQILTYISGINAGIAKNIVDYRNKNGQFKSRQELLKVAKLGEKSFEQCAGFLRLESSNPLDNTGIHPESYEVTERFLKKLGLSLDNVGDPVLELKFSNINLTQIAKELNVGLETLKDIVEELKKPGRDVRDMNKKAILRNDVTDIKDLKEGMILDGTVRNIVDFGAFIDIGVHQDGLVHLSQLANRFVKHPLDVVKIGQIVKVKVIGIDEKSKKISLSMKDL